MTTATENQSTKAETRRAGEFCWINLLTPTPPEACAFFGKLLGWTYGEIPGMGYLIQVGGRNVGGLFDLHGPNTPPGTPPVIGVMVKVDSADATADKVNALGGKAMPAFDVMQNGRMAVCFDPNGAQFDLWQPKKETGTDVDTTLHGAPSWFETLTSDPRAAAKFYSDLFGWTAEPSRIPDIDYTTFKLGDRYVAGMMGITPEMGSMRPHWGVYFTVKDVDDAAKEAVKLGGKIMVPPTDIPTVGRFSGLVSPQGVMFYVIKYAS